MRYSFRKSRCMVLDNSEWPKFCHFGPKFGPFWLKSGQILGTNGKILAILEFSQTIHLFFWKNTSKLVPRANLRKFRAVFGIYRSKTLKMSILVKNGQILARNGQILVISEFSRHIEYNFFEEKHIRTTFIPKIGRFHNII